MSVRSTWVVAIALVGCGATPRTRGDAAAVRVIESPQRAPDLVRRAGDGTLVSRALLEQPEFAGVGVSRDGRFYSLHERGIGAAALHVGRMGMPPHEVLGFSEMEWAGEHTILYRQGDTWYRADPDDDSFTNVTSTKIVDIESDERREPTLVRVSPDGNRVIFSLPTEKGSKKRSPWVYDVRTREKKELLHNTRYDQILVDDAERPMFAVDHDPKNGLQLFERTERGWLERTVDLPPSTLAVSEIGRGKIVLAVGSEEKPRFVVWDPATRQTEEALPPGVSRRVRDKDLRTLLTFSGHAWTAVAPALTSLASELTLLGVSAIAPSSDRFWVASAEVGDRIAFYAIDVEARTIRELGPHVDRRAVVELASKQVSIADEPVVVYDAVAPVHGVVFYGGNMDWLYRDKLFRLFTSRGYHVVAGDENGSLRSVREAHVAWARTTFGELPIACVDISSTCEFTPGVTAMIRDEISPWDPPDDGAAPSTLQELRFGAGYLRARTLAEYDEETEYIRTQIAPARERAPVVGIGLRGSEHWLVSRFALIEGFLAHHFGGRMEPMVWSELVAAGVKVAFGMSKVPFLEGRKELMLTALTASERGELVAGFAELLDAYRDALAKGCTGFAQRVSTLKRPVALTKYRQSNEYLALTFQFQSDRRDSKARGCSEENAADNAISHIVDSR